jgi:uncharacterized protein YbjQ (UPF0145 family)
VLPTEKDGYNRLADPSQPDRNIVCVEAKYCSVNCSYILCRGRVMLITTTHAVEGQQISEYLGLVSGEAILGANIFKDFFAGIRDIVGGRSAAYEQELRKAKKIAIDEMMESARALGGNAIVGVDLDYETIGGGQGSNMLMVSASGTAVRLS